MKLGMVGSDGMHPKLYAAVLNAEPNARPAVPPLDHAIELQGGGEANVPDHYRDVVRVTTGEDIRVDSAFDGVSVTGWWSTDPESAAVQAEQMGVPHVTKSLSELVDSVDAGMVCTLDGNTHAELAMAFLQAGKPVFITKPPTDDPFQAAELQRVAEANDTYFFSSSPWKWSPAIESLVHAIEPLGSIRTVVATAPGIRGAYFYVIHQMELLQLVNPARPVSVRCVSDTLRHHIELKYDDGSMGLVIGLRGAKWMRHVVVYAENGYRETNISNLQRDEGMIRMLRAFCIGLKENRPPLPMAQSVEAVQLLAFAERSASNGGTEVLIGDA